MSTASVESAHRNSEHVTLPPAATMQTNKPLGSEVRRFTYSIPRRVFQPNNQQQHWILRAAVFPKDCYLLCNLLHRPVPAQALGGKGFVMRRERLGVRFLVGED